MNDFAVQQRSAELPTGFGAGASAVIAARDVGAVAAIAREEGEIKAAVMLARHLPRDEAVSFSRIMKALERPRLADDATYSFPRGKAKVEGPSVYLAREMARCWGNIRHGLRQVSADGEMIHIRGFAFDLETNTYVEAEDRFARKIQRKGKDADAPTQWVEPDERDLRELINKRGAILVRNCILQVIPSDVVDAAVERAKETLALAAEGKLGRNREDTLRRLVTSFDALGVSKAMLDGRLGHPVAQINAAELAELTQIYRALVDGQGKREDYFDFGPRPEAGARTSGLNDRLKGRAASPEAVGAELDAVGLGAASAPPPAAWEPGEDFPVPAPAGEVEQSAGEPSPLDVFAQLAFDTEPKGGGASELTRERLRELARTLLPPGEEAYERVMYLAGAEKLGQGQAGKLVAAGKIAADALGVVLPSQQEQAAGAAAGGAGLFPDEEG